MPLFKRNAPPLTKKDISAPYDPTSFDKDVTKSWLNIPQSDRARLSKGPAEVIRSRADLFDQDDVMTSAPLPGYSELPPRTEPSPACSPSFKPDEFYNLEKMVSLNKDNIKDYIQSQEFLMITFYDPCQALCLKSRQQFLKWIKANDDDDMSFGAVNCGKNFHLCQAEDALRVPFHKVYSKGAHVNSFQFLEMQSVLFPKKKRVRTLPPVRQVPKPPCGSSKPIHNPETSI